MHYAILILSILLSLPLVSDMVHAEQNWNKWNSDDGVAVRQGNAIEWDQASARRQDGDLEGEVGYVWEDTRDGIRGIAMQVIDVNGNVKFEENGIQIFSNNFIRMEPKIIATPDGGWIVAWQDFRNPVPDILYTKVNSDGEIIWGVENQGLPVNSEHAYFDVSLLGDDQGGCFIIWGTVVDRPGTDIFATHLLANGELDAEWPEGGVDVTQTAHPDNYFSFIADGEGGFIISWLHAQNNSIDLLAQRVNNNGSLLWGDGEPIYICDRTPVREIPQIASDGDGGAFICWADWRDLQENAEDIYVQHVDADGNFFWADNGVALATGELQQLSPIIISSDPGYAVVTWESNDLVSHRTDIYAMMISGEQELELNWEPAEGLPIVVAQSDQRQISIAVDDDSGILFSWSDARNGEYPYEFDIYAQIVDFDGEIIWEENGVPVCQMEAIQSISSIALLGNGDCIVAWHPDKWYSGSAISAQIINIEGQVIEEDNGFDIATGVYGDARNSQLIPLDDGQFAIVWADMRNLVQGVMPMIQFYRDNGDNVETLFEGDGMCAIDDINNHVSQNFPAVEDGEGGVIVLWEENRYFSSFTVRGQRISSDGEKLWGENGLVVGESDLDLRYTIACPDGEGGVYFGYETNLPPEYYSVIFIQHIDSEGQLLWDNGAVGFSEENTECKIRQISTIDNESVVVLWEKESHQNLDELQVSRISEYGEHLWGENDGINLTNNELIAYPVMVSHPDGVAITWRSKPEVGGETYSLKTQFIETDGTRRWHENGTAITESETYKSNPQMAVDDDGYIWVVWTDRYLIGAETTDRLKVQKIVTFEGEANPYMLFGENGQLVTENGNYQNYTQVVHDGDNGVWIAWSANVIDYDIGVFATHLNVDGEMVENWDPDGNLVCDLPFHQTLSNAALLRESGEDGIVLVWDDDRSSGGAGYPGARVACDDDVVNNIYMQRVDDFVPESVKDDFASNPTGTYQITGTYPNPFNSHIQLNYNLSVNTDVSFKVFDITGRSLVNIESKHMKIGDHSISVDATNWSTGVYLAQLTAGNVSKTVKLTCIK